MARTAKPGTMEESNPYIAGYRGGNGRAVGSGLRQPLVEKYKPREIEDFLGLDMVKKEVLNYLADPTSSKCWMFYGEAGQGKSSMAYAIARRVGVKSEMLIQHVGSKDCNLARFDDIIHKCQLVPLEGSHHVVIIDEFDLMTAAVRDSMLSIMDFTEALPNTIIILTSNVAAVNEDTKPDMLRDRFLSRVDKVEFPLPSRPQLREFLEKIWVAESAGHPLPEDKVMEEIIGPKKDIRKAVARLEQELMRL